MTDAVAMIALFAFLFTDFPSGSVAKSIQCKAWIGTFLVAIVTSAVTVLMAIYADGGNL